MKDKKFRELIKSAIPSQLYDWLLYLRYSNKDALNKNREWLNVGKGRRAWVLATGPSINQQDLNLLAGEDCYSVSNFFLHDSLSIVSPKAHFFAPYHPPLIRENYLDWLRNANYALPPSTSVVLGLADYDMIENSKVFGDRKRYYLALGAKRYGRIDCTRLVPEIMTGPQMIINLLIYAGYKKIYLIGCDHNTLRNYGDIVENFYTPEKDVRVNAIKDDGWLPIKEHLQTQIIVFKIYEEFKLKNQNVEIVNCSPSSWLRFTKIKTKEFGSVIGI